MLLRLLRLMPPRMPLLAARHANPPPHALPSTYTLATQAFMTALDPYANAYNLRWRNMSTWNKDERNLGRGGWVGTRNYELVRWRGC